LILLILLLKDGTFEVRESLRDLLSNCKLSTKNGFKRTVQAVTNNYKKYQMDKHQIWKCCQSLGKNHSKFVLILVPYLLSLHPVFEMPEADMDDPICKYLKNLISLTIII
jgi:integrator complex subunit 4